MEIAGFVVAVLAVVAAGASALYARGANARADTANSRATDALDLQRVIDARDREFRDVRWELHVERNTQNARFTDARLVNVGLTEAQDITLVVESKTSSEAIAIASLQPGEFAVVRSTSAATWFEENEKYMPLTPQFRVHWSSPLGQSSESCHDGKVFFGDAQLG